MHILVFIFWGTASGGGVDDDWQFSLNSFHTVVIGRHVETGKTIGL